MKKQSIFVPVMVLFMVTLLSCELAYGGRIVAWGNNSDGQCNVPAGSDFVAIAAGEDYSVALKSDGSLVACGNNDDGQCDVPTGNDFTRIVATYRHTVALRSNGSLAAWGNNEWFQSDVPAGSNYVDIAAGAFHSIALKSDGSLVAWGDNAVGQCNVPGGNDYVAVAAGWYHNVALKADGYIVAWGLNNLGQLDVPPGNDFIAVSAGWFHNIAIKANGSLVAWGHNSHGQSNVPTGDNFVQTAAGKFHSLTLDSDGSLAAWGSNNQGQCNVPSGSEFVAVAAGRSHSLALVGVHFVDTDAVGANDGSSWEDAFNTYIGLQTALAVASSGDQIRVAQGVYKPDITNGIVPPSRSATFQLKNGVTIKGGYAGFGEPDPDARDIELYETILTGDLNGDDGRDFFNNDENSYHVVTGSNTNETAILDGFTVTAGNADGPSSWQKANCGGGMYNYENASPTLTNCTFRRNWARGGGGGMYNRSASNLTHPTLTNCTFNGNYAKSSGGAIMFHIGNAESTTVLTNCIFSGNSAGWFGGGIDNIGSDLILNNCAFVGNWVEWDDGTCGALRITENSRQTITNCISRANLPDQIGGDSDGWIRVTHSDIQDGWQEWYDEDKGNIDVDPLFVDADGPDGIIGTEDDNLRLQADSPCIDVGDNSVVTAATDLDGKPRIVNGTVDMGAYEHQLPRVIYVDTDAVGANDGSSWEDAFNTYIGLQTALAVASSGDQIRVAQGVYKPDITNGIVPPSRSATFQLKNGVTIKGGYAGFGEPDPDARDIELYETILTGDLNGDDGPDFANYGDNCYHIVTGTATDTTAGLDGFTIRGGNADSSNPNDRGGGMFNGQHSGPTVTNCTFNGNWAGFRGGGMYNADYCGLTVTACTFSANLASTGGGMSNDEDSTTVVTNCTFSANHATSTGGGMHNEESSSSSLIVTGCTFSGNSADEGGGMRNNGQDGPCNPIVTDCIFSGNWADTGGGMYNNGDEDHGTCSPILTNCTFTGNLADNKGGGMYNYGNEGACNPELINCTFNGNWAGFRGGGMYNNGDEGTCNPELINCTFGGNSAGDQGGGMYNRYSNPILTNCIFTNNSAGDEGGGMHNYETVSIISGCTFIGNSAPGGGGLNLDNEIGSTLTNCIFSGNRAEDGGGIRGEDENVTMINCTFSGNSADNGGGGICMDENIQLTNCIFWGNVAHGSMDESAQIRMRNSVSTIINYSCIQGWTGGWAGVGNIDVDPVFVDADGPDDIIGTADDNLRLLPWSPCIDVGDNSLVEPNSTDLDGNPRIINDIVDMGAYEAPVSIEADVYIVPRVINRRSHIKRVLAIMRLPKGINKTDVSDEPFVLYAGDSDSDGIEATWQRVIGRGSMTRVFVLFDKDEVMNAVEGVGRVELTVVGRLESGQYIQGSDTVRIVKPRRRRPRWKSRRKN